jgi:hypothetical protein
MATYTVTNPDPAAIAEGVPLISPRRVKDGPDFDHLVAGDTFTTTKYPHVDPTKNIERGILVGKDAAGKTKTKAVLAAKAKREKEAADGET